MLSIGGSSYLPPPQLSLRTPVYAYNADKVLRVIPALSDSEKSFSERAITLPGAGEQTVVDAWGSAKVQPARVAHTLDVDATRISQRESLESFTKGGEQSKHKIPAAPSSATAPLRPIHQESQNRGWNTDVKTAGMFDPTLPKVTLFSTRRRDRKGETQEKVKGSPSAYELPVAALPEEPRARTSIAAKQRQKRRRSLLRKPDPRWAHISSQYSQKGSAGPVQAVRKGFQTAGQSTTEGPAVKAEPPTPQLAAAPLPPPLPPARDPKTEAPQTPLPLLLPAPLPDSVPSAPPSWISPTVLAASATDSGPLSDHTSRIVGQWMPPTYSSSPVLSGAILQTSKDAPPQAWSSPPASGSTRSTPLHPNQVTSDSPGHGIDGQEDSRPSHALDMISEQTPCGSQSTQTAAPSNDAPLYTGGQPRAAPQPFRYSDAARVLGGAAASTADLMALLRRLSDLQAAETGAKLALEVHQAVAIAGLTAQTSALPVYAATGTAAVSRALRTAAHELIAGERVALHLGHRSQGLGLRVLAGSESLVGRRTGGGTCHASGRSAEPSEVQHHDARRRAQTTDTSESTGNGSAGKFQPEPSTQAATGSGSLRLSEVDRLRRHSNDDLLSLPLTVVMAVADAEVLSEVNSATGAVKHPTGSKGLGITNNGSPLANSKQPTLSSNFQVEEDKGLRGGRPVQRKFPTQQTPPSQLFSRQRPGFSSDVLHQATAHSEAVHRCARINDVTLTTAGIDAVRLVSDAAAAIANVIVAEVAAELTAAVDDVADAIVDSV